MLAGIEGIELFEKAFDRVAQGLRERIAIVEGEECRILPAGYDSGADPDHLLDDSDATVWLANEEAIDSDTVFSVSALCKAILADPACPDMTAGMSDDFADGVAWALTGRKPADPSGAEIFDDLARSHLQPEMDMGFDPDTRSIFLWFKVKRDAAPSPHA